MAKVHDRILQIAFTADESADTVVGTAVYYYRDRSQVDASNPETIAASFGSAAATAEVTLNQIIPPPTHIQLASTFQA